MTTSSSSLINYNLRQNKAIERKIVFEGLRSLQQVLPWTDCAYIGLGSAWFVDFDLAHRDLGIQTMISIESDEITYKRALFNKPFRTVKVVPGYSYDETPKLLQDPELNERPWLVWLDYDHCMDGTKLAELKSLVTGVAPNSVVMTTFDAHPGSYGTTNEEKLAELVEIFGPAFPLEDYPNGKGLNKFETMQNALARSVLDDLESHFRSSGRLGGFHRIFDLQYQDGTPMVTVGVAMTDDLHSATVAEVVADSSWRGNAPEPITSPPLTPKEIATLRSLLPSDPPPTRRDLKKAKMDLTESNLASFVRYYLDYPIYVESIR